MKSKCHGPISPFSNVPLRRRFLEWQVRETLTKRASEFHIMLEDVAITDDTVDHLLRAPTNPGPVVKERSEGSEEARVREDHTRVCSR